MLMSRKDKLQVCSINNFIIFPKDICQKWQVFFFCWGRNAPFFVLNFGGGEISWQAEYRVLQWKLVEKEISTLEKKRKKLTDMYLDDKISKEAYEEKYSERNRRLEKCEEERLLFSENAKEKVGYGQTHKRGNYRFFLDTFEGKVFR